MAAKSTSRLGRDRKGWWWRALISLVALQATAAALAGWVYVAYDNPLGANPDWTATKTKMARHLMGAHNFVEGRAATTQTKLDLGAWYGYQEVILNRDISSAVTEVSFDFALDDNAYVNFLYNKSEAGCAGIRLSRNPGFQSAFFVADGLGRFTEKRLFELSKPLGRRTRHHARVRFTGDQAIVEVDGKQEQSVTARLEPGTRIGFRGSLARAIIDEVVVRGRGGSVFRESFLPLRRGAWLAAIGFGICLALSGGWLLRARRQPSGAQAARRAVLTQLALFLVATVCLAAVLVYLLALRKQTYPVEAELKAAEQAWLQDEVAPEVTRRIRTTFSPKPAPSTFRIMVIGTSQTWGAGAAKEEHTLLVQLQRMLAERSAGRATRVECIDAAVPGLDSSSLIEPLYLANWIELEPHLVVANLSHNDPRVGMQLTKNLERLAQANRERDIATLFVGEAVSVENENLIEVNHQRMQRVAERYHFPFLNMHTHVRELSDTGFVWWDGIHLTSYGQSIVAAKLAEVIWQEYLSKLP